MHVVIPRGMLLPADVQVKCKRADATASDFAIEILEGESAVASENRKVAVLNVTGIPSEKVTLDSITGGLGCLSHLSFISYGVAYGIGKGACAV